MENLNLRLGESARIGLAGAAMAGYTWLYHVTMEGVISVEQEKADDKTGALRAGESKLTLFTVTAQAAGNVQLTFVLKRSWEQGVAPVSSKEYTVHVA